MALELKEEKKLVFGYGELSRVEFLLFAETMDRFNYNDFAPLRREGISGMFCHKTVID
jgi:hypothetical protein